MASDPRAELALVIGSPAFQLLHRAMLGRREELLTEELVGEFAIAKNRGAIEEVQKWLRHPELILKYAELQRAQAAERATRGLPDERDDMHLDRLRRVIDPASNLDGAVHHA